VTSNPSHPLDPPLQCLLACSQGSANNSVTATATGLSDVSTHIRVVRGRSGNASCVTGVSSCNDLHVCRIRVSSNFDSHCKILISKQSYQLSQPAALRALCCTSGMTSHRQPRQCRGIQGPKTAKGPKVTRIVYQDTYPVANGSLRNSMQKCGKILRGRKILSPPWFQHCEGERPVVPTPLGQWMS